MIMAETRFYGRSLDSDMLRLSYLITYHFIIFFICFIHFFPETQYLKYNNARQTLADLANLQTNLMDKLSLSKNRWVVWGASFSGVMSVFYRQKSDKLWLITKLCINWKMML